MGRFGVCFGNTIDLGLHLIPVSKMDKLGGNPSLALLSDTHAAGPEINQFSFLR